MKKIVFVTTSDAEYGFRLAGVTQYTADPEDVENRAREIIARPEVGLLILDERVAKGLSEERLSEIEQGWHGILLILPAPERGAAAVEDYMVRLIRRAIGYHVRLQL